MSKQNGRAKGQSTPERFVKLNYWPFDSPAYRSLSIWARSLYTEICRRYNGRNNGEIHFSHREAQSALGDCSSRPVIHAFNELREKGFIDCQRAGKFAKAGGHRRAAEWLLTEYPVDLPVRELSPRKDFMNWKPVETADTKNNARARGMRSTCERHTVKAQNHLPTACEKTAHIVYHVGGARSYPSKRVLPLSLKLAKTAQRNLT